VDLRFKDATNLWASATDIGGVVDLFAIATGTNSLMVLTTYGQGTVETLLLTEMDERSATLVRTVSRAHDLMSNARITVGKCLVTTF
jgi:hypothetical protein